MCVCLCAAPLPSDPHECVSKVHVFGCGFMCVMCVRAYGGEALQ